MPFTLSHPAAVLPLHRWTKSRLPLSALAIGAITPDVAYFIPLSLGSESHSLLGLTYFCWPVGMALWLIFEFFLKAPTIDLLPSSLRNRLPRGAMTLSVSSLTAVSLAIVLGGLSHIVWDSFTHAHTPIVVASEILRTPVITIGNDTIRVYKALQHASTVFGGLVLLIAAIRRWKSPHDRKFHAAPDKFSDAYRLWVIAFVVATTLAGAAIYAAPYSGGSLERTLFFVCIGGMTGFSLAWCAVATLIRFGKSPLTGT